MLFMHQEHHKEDCGKFPLKCENCGHQVPREKVGEKVYILVKQNLTAIYNFSDG